MWICFLVLVLCIGISIGFIAGRLIPTQQNVGEALVANTITATLKRPHLLLNNVTLQNGESTSQIDHILVAETGVFVIESKHYAGWILGDCHGTKWTQVIYRKKSRFQNPIRQNYGHVKTLQALFNLPADAFLSLVVFTGDAEFKTDLGPTVIKLAQLPAYLAAERKVLFDERQMTYIVGRIEMKRMRRSLETDEYHLSGIRRRGKAFH
jgi:restriction system protein